MSIFLALITILVAGDQYKRFPKWLKTVTKYLNYSKTRRTAVLASAVVIMSLSCILAFVICEDDGDNKISENTLFPWVICLFALATAIRINYRIKTFLVLLLVTVYAIVVYIPKYRKKFFPLDT